MYEIVLTGKAAKALERATPSTRRRFVSVLERIKANPWDGKKLHGELVGLLSWRIGGPRAVYKVDSDPLVVVVVSIQSRGDVYKS